MDIITDSAVLKERLAPLHNEKFVTIDTEFLREKTYYPLLCLVQVAGDNDAFAIDPLAADIDLTPLYDLLVDPKTLKVFHACKQDMEILFYAMDKLPRSVFDTQVAAQVLGYGEAAGYGALVEKICHIKLDKSSRHTDWSRRPLSRSQVDYAISDVTHLRLIYTYLKKELDLLDRNKWLDQEMEPLIALDTYKQQPEDAWKMLKIRTTTPRFLAIVKEVAQWREERARHVDKPRQWILKNDGIMEIAAAVPKTPEDLGRLRYYNTKDEDINRSLISAVEKGINNENPPKLEKKKPLPQGCGPLMDLLKVLLKMQCEHHNVAPSVVARTEDLEAIAMHHKDGMPDINCMRGWRLEVFGQYAMALKHGKLGFTVQGRKIILIEPVDSQNPEAIKPAPNTVENTEPTPPVKKPETKRKTSTNKEVTTDKELASKKKTTTPKSSTAKATTSTKKATIQEKATKPKAVKKTTEQTVSKEDAEIKLPS